MTETYCFRFPCQGRDGPGFLAVDCSHRPQDDAYGNPEVSGVVILLERNRPGCESLIREHDAVAFLTPDDAKRLAIALNHLAFRIDPASAALGVG
jgi:hypothetical protein